MFAGDHDMALAVSELAAALPVPLRALATVAYDYRWSWSRDGATMFEVIDPECWKRTVHNPRRLLSEVPRATLDRAAARPGFPEWVASIATEFASV